jgi:hypothetical protein
MIFLAQFIFPLHIVEDHQGNEKTFPSMLDLGKHIYYKNAIKD